MTESYKNPQPGERLRVSTEDKKYTIIQTEAGDMRFLRHGVDWTVANESDWRHAGMILSLAQDLKDAQDRVANIVERARQQTGIDFS